ncbi:MAG: hypothetical protein ACOX17_08425 [Christensenellales bacterium]
MDLIFHCEITGKISGGERHTDNNQTGYAWLEIDQLSTLPLYPSKLRRQIMHYFRRKPYRVYLGN